MFSFFKKKPPLITDLSWLGVDLHSHLLPGLDDGSPDLGTSISLIKGLNELGFYKFICTPHIFKELYPNTRETILPALAAVQEELKSQAIPVDIAAAGEHMVDEHFRVVDGLMSLPGNHLLIEMSYLNETPNIDEVVFDLQIKGYKVILAHPERYIFYQRAQNGFHRMKERGVLFQLNLLSITGYYGKDIKRTAEFLLGQNYYDLAATDLHNEKHLKVLTQSVRDGYVHKTIGNYPFKNQELFGKG